jgi:hypothetical protein
MRDRRSMPHVLSVIVARRRSYGMRAGTPQGAPLGR